ncbi:MAG TPA: GAF domain-containing protein, partial [Anaerolineales bacterium]|nr:GAF domain-containing protein [Anaerolineales bacterium]
MISFFKRILTPPVFDDEIKTQQAYMLHIILWTLVCVPIPYFIYSLFATPDNLARPIAQTVFGIVSNILLIIVMRYGYVRAASVFQPSLFWLFFTATAITGNGVQGEAYLIGYLLVITIAGILLGGRGSLVFIFLSLGTGALMLGFYEQAGFDNSPLTTWVISLILFPVIAVLQHLSSHKVRDRLLHARASEERYRLISQVSSDYTFSTIVGTDGEMHLDWVAGAFEQITGFSYDEYVASGGWLAHLHPDDVEIDMRDMETIRQNKKVITEVRTITKNRQVRWVRVYGHPVWDHKNNKLIGIVGAVQDITDHKRVAIREAAHQASLEKVLELGKHVTESKDLETTFKRIWHAVRYDLEFDRLGIYLYDAEYNTMNGTYGTNNQGEMIDESDQIKSLNSDSLETKTFLKVLRDANGLYFTHQYDTDHNIQENPVMLGVKDYAAVAAWSGTKPVAVLCVDNAISQQPINEEQLESLRLFAGYAGLAIENTRLNDALQYELTQQKQAEESKSRRRAMLEKVVLLGQQVTEVKDLKITLERIWHGVHDDIGFDRLAIFLYDQKSNTLNGTLGTDNEGNIVEEWDYQRTLDNDKPTSFTRALEQPNGLFYTNQFGMEFDIPKGHEMHHVKDFAAVSAWANDKPVAIITVDNNPTGKPFTSAQLEALRLFG